MIKFAELNLVARYIGASVFSGSWINRSWIDGSHGFTIPILYDINHQFVVSYWTLCVCVCLLCICDILWLTSAFLCHKLGWYPLSQHFSYRLPSSWSMATSQPLYKIKSVLKVWKYYAHTVSNSQLQSCMCYFCIGALSPYLSENSGLAARDWSWEWLTA